MRFTTTSTTWVSIPDLAVTFTGNGGHINYALGGVVSPIRAENTTVLFTIAVDGVIQENKTWIHSAPPEGSMLGCVFPLEVQAGTRKITPVWRIADGQGVQLDSPQLFASE